MMEPLLKRIETNIPISVFFYELQLNIDAYKDEFIDIINKGIEENNNYNYKTNVLGKMTDWKLFLNNKKFYEVLNIGFEVIKQNLRLKPAYLAEAWGIKIDQGDETLMHDHFESLYSGILYLSDSDLVTFFPEINVRIKPKVGTFLFFSGPLKHGTEKNTQEKSKYAIPFNFAESKKF